MVEALEQAVAWLHAGLGVALAALIRTWGSSARPVGSQFVGDERSEFGMTNEAVWKVRLSCGARVEIYAEPAIGVLRRDRA